MAHIPISFDNVSPASLRPYAKNARRRSSKVVRAIAASITEFGFTSPIVIDETGEIIAGHGRLEAANLLKLKTVPVVRVSGLDVNQKNALRLADNKLVLDGSWSPEFLSAALSDLLSADFDISTTGFDAIELDAALTPIISKDDFSDVLPQIPKIPVSRCGDVWQLGQHRVTVADARIAESYQAVLCGRLADMVFGDGPYNVRIQGNVSGKGRSKHSEFQMASGEMADAEFAAFLTLVLSLARDNSRDGSLHYLCADWRMIGLLNDIGKKLFAQLMNIAVWVKANAGLGSFYRSQHEMIAIFKNGRGSHINNIQLGRMGRYRTNVWQYPGASGFSKTRTKDLADHPTVKPVALVADAIRDATKPGDLVLDPFGGSGTTLMAAETVNRRAALIEIEPKYVDVTLERFQGQTGIEPVLLPHGIPLSAVRSERKASKMGAEL